MKLKDKRIIIAEGSYPIHPGKLWAYFRQLSGKEAQSAGVAGFDEEVVFTVNWRDDIDTGYYVKCGEVVYSITRIDTFEGYKRDLTLYCKKMIRGVTIHDYEES